jgi:hypothetical protein
VGLTLSSIERAILGTGQPTKRKKRSSRPKVVKRTLTIKMKGKLSEINSFCSAIGSLSNDYDLEVDF